MIQQLRQLRACSVTNMEEFVYFEDPEQSSHIENSLLVFCNFSSVDLFKLIHCRVIWSQEGLRNGFLGCKEFKF